MTSVPWARFDDLTSGRALVCPPPYRVLTTDRPAAVPGILAAVEAATAAGDWAFGYVSYEAAPAFDTALATATRSAHDPPLIWFGLCGAPVRAAPVDAAGDSWSATGWIPDWTPGDHAGAVAEAREHIAAGDIYQCNLTDRLRATAAGDPHDLYAALVTAQHAAYNAYLDLGRFAVASASPELFFAWTGDRIRTRPMKGTIARSGDPDDDARQAHRLRSSTKDQAENLMIVDLLRNDVGKIAAYGSVRVPELFTLERYPTVWQLTSEITARLRTGCGLVDIFAALFPCGSVTGAPKARSMQIIRDLEAGPRGVYCGAVGLVAPPAAGFRARFNVAIRTAVIDRETATAVYGAGGGITWDSDPAAEHAELLSKTRILTTGHHR